MYDAGERVKMKDILERDRTGNPVSIDDSDYYIIKEIILDTKRLVQDMNTRVLDCDGARDYFITGTDKNPTLNLITPFYTDFGRNIRVGKNVFINNCCTFMDRGAITIGDGAFIGPRVNLITENHGITPASRRTLTSRPIVIGKNVWIGAAATILPGVKIGDNSIIGAGAVVTCNVPPNMVVAGNPAKIIGKISDAEEKQ